MITRNTIRSYFLREEDPRLTIVCNAKGEEFLVRRIGESLREVVGASGYEVHLYGPVLRKDGTPHAVRTHCMGWTNGLDGVHPGQIPFPEELRHLLVGPDAMKGALLGTY